MVEAALTELAPWSANGGGEDGEIDSELSIMDSLLNRYADLDAGDAELQRLLRRLNTGVLARSWMRSGDGERAAKLLRDHCGRCRRDGLVRSFISHSILLATACWEQGRRRAAMAAFEDALAPALFESIKRPFIDAGETLAKVIGGLAAAPESQRGNRIRDRFLAELVVAIGDSWPSSEGGGDQLTPRELEVLRHLIQGRSNGEIAMAMPISVNTVKFHLKNIFGKLGVNTRKDAVSAALRGRRC